MDINSNAFCSNDNYWNLEHLGKDQHYNNRVSSPEQLSTIRREGKAVFFNQKQ